MSSLRSKISMSLDGLLGSGARLFDGVGDDLHGLALVLAVAAPNVTHLKFAKR